MYGTVCHFRLKPGMEAKLASFADMSDSVGIIGLRTEYVYQMDKDSSEYMMAVVFDSEEAYKRNAGSPDQDARYRMFRELLVADPEWNDGKIVHSHVSERV